MQSYVLHVTQSPRLGLIVPEIAGDVICYT